MIIRLLDYPSEVFVDPFLCCFGDGVRRAHIPPPPFFRRRMRPATPMKHLCNSENWIQSCNHIALHWKQFAEGLFSVCLQLKDHAYNLAWPMTFTLHDLLQSIQEALGMETGGFKTNSAEGAFWMYPTIRRGPLNVSKVQKRQRHEFQKQTGHKDKPEMKRCRVEKGLIQLSWRRSWLESFWSLKIFSGCLVSRASLFLPVPNSLIKKRRLYCQNQKINYRAHQFVK